MSMRAREAAAVTSEAWPALPWAEWKHTYATLHMWTQIVGKVRLALSPRVNHWWDVALYVSARGLTTSPIPYGTEIFEVEFDFIAHKLKITTSRGKMKTMALEPRSVADFYREFMEHLESLGIKVKIWTMPSEVPRPHSVRGRQDSCFVRSRICAPILAVIGDARFDFQGISRRIHRQGQPGALFLGQLRFMRHQIFGAASAGASRSGFHHARGVFARSHQRRILAGQRGDGCGVLCICRSGAGGVWRCSRASRRCALYRGQERIFPAV